MKYMVMECHPGYAVVLSDDGRFLKVANMRYEVGQTVTNVVEACLPQVQEQPVKKTTIRWISSLAAMAACLVLVVTSIFFTGQMPYASVYLTINPEVRIDVNRGDVVVGVEGMNADGADLLEGYEYKNKDLDLVMDELVDRAIDMGYLHEGGTITLTLDADDEWIVSHSEHLTTHLNDHLTDKITVTIDVEQKQPAQEASTAPTAPTGTIVIPVDPDHYGESDYGEETEDGGDSEYAPSDDGDSAYDSSDDGQTDYDDTTDDDGQTDYGDTTDDDGQTDYDDTTDDDGQTDYGDTTDDDGQTDYDDTTDDDGQTDYGNTEGNTDDGQSEYESDQEDDPDDGQSDYDQSDDGQSEYEESDDDDDD